MIGAFDATGFDVAGYEQRSEVLPYSARQHMYQVGEGVWESAGKASYLPNEDDFEYSIPAEY